jgi:hypothetical protein
MVAVVCASFGIAQISSDAAVAPTLLDAVQRDSFVTASISLADSVVYNSFITASISLDHSMVAIAISHSTDLTRHRHGTRDSTDLTR